MLSERFCWAFNTFNDGVLLADLLGEPAGFKPVALAVAGFVMRSDFAIKSPHNARGRANASDPHPAERPCDPSWP
jgi:hypothetical protein